MSHSYLKSIIALLLLSVSITSCVNDSSVSPISNTAERTSFSLYSVRDYGVSPETGELRVSFYESERIYSVPAAAKNFESMLSRISASKDQHLPIQISVQPNNELNDAIEATPEEINTFKQRFIEEPEVRDQYQMVIGSMEELSSIFKWIQEQNCADGNAKIDFCIPFQYKIDGCYARAHKMREILQQRYGYGCNKIFSHGGIWHSLAVNNGDCCVYWGWHDAPVVKVNTDNGVVQMVIDPSLFDHAVTLAEWLTVQDDATCDPNAKVASYQIVPGSYYFEDGTQDNDYHQTNMILKLYRDLQTCN